MDTIETSSVHEDKPAGHTTWTATFSFPGITPGIGDTWQIDCDGHAVCTTQFCYAPNTEANVRLITAAPDFLAAAQSLLEAWDARTTGAQQIITGKSDRDLQKQAADALEGLRAAISKALPQVSE